MGESENFVLLAADSKQRYRQKISTIENIDLYALKREDFLFEMASYPRISYPDIVNYLLFVPSFGFLQSIDG